MILRISSTVYFFFPIMALASSSTPNSFRQHKQYPINLCVVCVYVCVCVLSCLLTSCAYYDGVLRFPPRRDTRRAHEQPRTVVPWLYPTYGDGAADTLWVRQNPFLEKSRTSFLTCLAGFFFKKKITLSDFSLEIRKVNRVQCTKHLSRGCIHLLPFQCVLMSRARGWYRWRHASFCRLWCAMSSPLTLSLDFTNKTAVEYVHRTILAMYRYAISITSSASYLWPSACYFWRY